MDRPLHEKDEVDSPLLTCGPMAILRVHACRAPSGGVCLLHWKEARDLTFEKPKPTWPLGRCVCCTSPSLLPNVDEAALP